MTTRTSRIIWTLAILTVTLPLTYGAVRAVLAIQALLPS